VEVAARANVSQSTISRMELGRGGSISLESWGAVAEAVGCRLTADLVSDARAEEAGAAAQVVRRCHALIGDTARAGGWTAVTEVTADVVETVLVRSFRAEVAVVRVWDAIAGIDAAALAFVRAVQREFEDRADPTTVGGLVVALHTMENRRRVAESRAVLMDVVPGSGSRWLAALRSPRTAMPTSAGLLWVSPDGSRIKLTPHRPGWG
jgi:helix-turn-helix protein